MFRIYDKLFDRWNRTYDRRVRPLIGSKNEYEVVTVYSTPILLFISEGPVDIETFVYVLGIGTISEVTMVKYCFLGSS